MSFCVITPAQLSHNTQCPFPLFLYRPILPLPSLLFYIYNTFTILSVIFAFPELLVYHTVCFLPLN